MLFRKSSIDETDRKKNRQVEISLINCNDTSIQLAFRRLREGDIPTCFLWRVLCSHTGANIPRTISIMPFSSALNLRYESGSRHPRGAGQAGERKAFRSRRNQITSCI